MCRLEFSDAAQIRDAATIFFKHSDLRTLTPLPRSNTSTGGGSTSSSDANMQSSKADSSQSKILSRTLHILLHWSCLLLLWLYRFGRLSWLTSVLSFLAKMKQLSVINSGSTRDRFMQLCLRQLWFTASFIPDLNHLNHSHCNCYFMSNSFRLNCY